MRFWTGIIIVLCAIESPAVTKIACIGNSITYGYGLSNPSSQSYPGKLQQLLGTSYNVQNDGVSATTLSKKGDNPYWKNGQLPQVFAFQPDIITIKLGTNDSKPQNWENLGRGSQFKTDYLALIDTLAAMQSHPKIYLILPVPVFPNPTAVSWGIRDSIVQKQIPIIKEVAAARSLSVIDANAPLKNFPQYFKVDGVHPDATAEDTLAHIVYRALTAKTEVVITPGDQKISHHGQSDFPHVSTIEKCNWSGCASMDKITFQSIFTGMKKEITIFDCAGRSLRKVVTARQTISLTRDFSLPRGVYFIKTSVKSIFQD